MKRALIVIGLATALGSAGLAASGWCMVGPGEVAVVRRFGRVLQPAWGPGLHWRLPAGIDRVDRIRTDAVRRITIGQAGTPAADQEPSTGEMLTGDLNLLRIEATVQYRVADPIDHALRGRLGDDWLRRAAEASLSRAMARREVDAVLRSDRLRIAQDVRDDLQSAADGLRLGVRILGVSLTDARPPVEVAADFAEAQSAESRRDDRINRARTYEAVERTTAEARGGSIRDSARSEAARTLLAARAEADQFLALLGEVRRAPALSTRRYYIESVQAMLGRVRRKLILPPGQSVDLTIMGAREPADRPTISPQSSRRDAAQDQQPRDDR
jgi:modulator of FtsH protease HflK